MPDRNGRGGRNRGQCRDMLLLRMLVAAALVAVVAGCDDETARDNAVEAREGNAVELGGLTYRVVLFRQLNPRATPESALVDGVPPAGEGYYAAFLSVCNASDGTHVPTDDIHLEDAFGKSFAPLDTDVNAELTYEPRRLPPEACEPADDSAADETYNGAALVFSVPFDAVQRRPMVLEIQPRGGGVPARVQLDL
ncbi:MAG TPA: hypothetical protein VFM58_16010 [Solirubrobacteraceae bacterium]|nr:hypothetical protein [Solirubrobacteraceae bacterium]